MEYKRKYKGHNPQPYLLWLGVQTLDIGKLIKGRDGEALEYFCEIVIARDF